MSEGQNSPPGTAFYTKLGDNEPILVGYLEGHTFEELAMAKATLMMACGIALMMGMGIPDVYIARVFQDTLRMTTNELEGT